jgi:two-component system response regulator FixJ
LLTIASSDDSTIAAKRFVAALPSASGSFIGVDPTLKSHHESGAAFGLSQSPPYSDKGRFAAPDRPLTVSPPLMQIKVRDGGRRDHNDDIAAWRRVMIFIVDDDSATRESLRFLLEAEGFEAQEFAAGLLFLDGARPVGGDCLILDVNMPGMSGIEVLEELRRRGHRVPVIIVTAYPDETTRNRASAAGALAILEKPHGADELLALVRRALTGAMI